MITYVWWEHSLILKPIYNKIAQSVTLEFNFKSMHRENRENGCGQFYDSVRVLSFYGKCVEFTRVSDLATLHLKKTSLRKNLLSDI